MRTQFSPGQQVQLKGFETTFLVWGIHEKEVEVVTVSRLDLRSHRFPPEVLVSAGQHFPCYNPQPGDVVLFQGTLGMPMTVLWVKKDLKRIGVVAFAGIERQTLCFDGNSIDAEGLPWDLVFHPKSR